MIFEPTPLAGAYIVKLEMRGDERGFFARVFCQDEFAARGLETRIAQISNSSNARAGTLRGMHYQLPPKNEVKMVRCIRGAIWDCIVDLRPDSPTYRKWFGTELSAENRHLLYIPHGFAHGFMTLTDDVEPLYLISEFYAPECERGLRWNDPALGIEWPREPVEMSEKDRNWPLFDEAYHGVERFAGMTDSRQKAPAPATRA